MEVTNSNFKSLLPQIQAAIDAATFVAIDCELTGLDMASEINAFDTPKQYYEKLYKNSKDFLVIQYGLSAFRFDPAFDGFKQQTYNFYIFRKPINRNLQDQRFLCQSSSIDFLISQGFDFNKVFKSGISYLNVSEENLYRSKLEERQKIRSNHSESPKEIIPIPEDLKSLVDDIMGQLEDFIDSGKEELDLPKCNPFVRRLIYQTVAQRYKNKVVLQTKQLKNKDRIMVATQFKSKDEQERDAQKLIQDELMLLDDVIGFTKVLRCLVDSGKLIVGHNMCLDFMHTIDKFLTPLPKEYEEFKECSHSLFKNVLDTKLLASSDDFKDLISSTILNDVLETVTKDPFQLPLIEIEDDGQGYSMKDAKLHEAGYDAYITGLCFLSMWNYLGNLKRLATKDIFTNFNLFDSCCNKLYLMILKDNQYINLNGRDPNPPRDHVFYLTFPRDWKLNNIIELFSPFGTVYVAWLNETSAYIALSKKEQASVALRTLSQSDTYKIMTYSERQRRLNDMSSLQPASVSKKRPNESSSKCNKRMKTESSSFATRERAHRVVAIAADAAKIKMKNTTSKMFSESEAWD